ncbi:type VII secretion target [Streptomyces sp. JJ36]|uniref:type VII secretion target n=1 Tax=Streptomyces sp. JJ36 TaxID=2736645 RepID=UPI001F169649|nr:type VII secretion target [Streptomyces sp. JJ36]MCF6525100.1 hypothetical protein [Streptomyces sp. JJ36]
MSFEEEWAQLKAAAFERQQAGVGMQLAGHDPDTLGPGGKPQLKVTPKVLREKAGTTDDVRGDLKKVDDEAMRETGQVKAGLKGFACADAFEAFEERWGAQMRFLQGVLENKVARALREAATLFEVNDRFPTGGDTKDHQKQQVAR